MGALANQVAAAQALVAELQRQIDECEALILAIQQAREG